MRGKKLSLGLAGILAIFTLAMLIASTRALAQTESVLHNFNVVGTSANLPEGGLVFDEAGNLYGTTYQGGAGTCYQEEYEVGCGAVFELAPAEGGGWTAKILHNFNPNGKDGIWPGSSLILDGAGNLYGTTENGGEYGAGTVFEVSPKAGGGWTERVLHNFNNNGVDGAYPASAPLTLDASGNLYGTAGGGAYGGGVVFELSPTASEKYTEKILHNFVINSTKDGAEPLGNVIFDSTGNLYGATSIGGTTFGCGTFFELSPATGGHWKEKILHDFGSGTDGCFPASGLIFDAAGNLYGTSLYGGVNTNCTYGGPTSCGTVFELSPNAGGGWTETVLHSFDNNGVDGTSPGANLVFDAAGNLFSTTYFGGAYNAGTMFELTPATGGSWTETIVHSFGSGTDGRNPNQGGPIIDSAGNLYDMTVSGGTFGGGTVYEITP